MAGKGKKKEITQKERLTKELKSLLPDIDEDGLIFLIQQANVLVHNRRVEKINREVEALKKTQDKKAPPKDSEYFTIEIQKADNGKTFYIIINGRKHFFDTDEIRKIVELCYRPPTKTSALKYLYQFFHHERDEILYDHKIKNEKSPFFDTLFKEIRSTFSLS